MASRSGLLLLCVCLCLWSLPEAAGAPTPAVVDSHACGDLIRELTAPDSDGTAYAVDVYNCYTTVPFDPAVGTRLIKYWNDTLQFHATLDYVKQPPSDYQQPAVDLIAGLEEIQSTINNNGFANEYQFEAALQNLLYSANDAHVVFAAGVLSAFSFGSYYGLTQVSVDGIQTPKVYITEDLISNQTKTDNSWQPSAITHINGTEVNDYLTRYAALNSPGTLEPHADWNLLFDSPAADVLGEYSLWSGDATFYPGDIFTYTFENTSILDDVWLASFWNPGVIGPLETGGDFYNYFVSGFLPAACFDSSLPTIPASCIAPNNTATTSVTVPTSYSDANLTTAYPNPDVAQSNLTIDGYVTGYFIHEQSLAVLSIPTFWADGAAIQDFTDTVQRFIDDSKAAGLTKVLIDLQQNDGGDVLLAYSVFKQFFPSIEPYAGSFMRAQPFANTMGTAITAYWDSLDSGTQQALNASADEWIAASRINAATDEYFTSWEEFFGPHLEGVEYVTLTERLNTSDFDFDFSTAGAENPPDVLLTPYAGDAPFAAENIVMLSDGLCSSACSLFMEMMHTDGGVKNVVIGGRPSYGPMQTPSGSRGARYYDVAELDADIENTIAIYNTTATPQLPEQSSDQDFYIYDAGVSLRAQIREGQSVPLAMQYEAADCRIWLTPSTFNNFSNLWTYAANAIWSQTQLCVQGSTGYAVNSSNTPSHALPAPSATPLPAINYTKNGVPALDLGDAGIPFLVSDEPMPDGDVDGSAQGRARQSQTQRARDQANALYVQNSQKPSSTSNVNIVRQKPLAFKPRVSSSTAPSRRHRRRRRSG